jgi:hypothetical protein
VLPLARPDHGLLAPAEVKRRAALIVGQDAVDRWNPDKRRLNLP